MTTRLAPEALHSLNTVPSWARIYSSGPAHEKIDAELSRWGHLIRTPQPSKKSGYEPHIQGESISIGRSASADGQAARREGQVSTARQDLRPRAAATTLVCRTRIPSGINTHRGDLATSISHSSRPSLCIAMESPAIS